MSTEDWNDVKHGAGNIIIYLVLVFLIAVFLAHLLKSAGVPPL